MSINEEKDKIKDAVINTQKSDPGSQTSEQKDNNCQDSEENMETKLMTSLNTDSSPKQLEDDDNTDVHKTELMDADINPLESYIQKEKNNNIDNDDNATKLISPESYHKGLEKANYKFLLKVVSKHDNGKEFIINKPEIEIGRSNNCDITFSHSEGISGSHARLYSEGDENYILDNKSSNGTFLNKNKLIPLQKYSLKNNDIIIIGEHKLKFIDTSQAKPKKLILTILAILVVPILLILIQNDNTKIEPIPDDKKTIVSNEEDGDDISKEYLVEIICKTANNYFEHQLWEEAIDEFNNVLNYKKNYSGVENKIKKAKAELLNRKKIEKARLLINQKMSDEAINLLKEIPIDSTYHIDAITEIKLTINQKNNNNNNEQAKKFSDNEVSQYVEKSTVKPTIDIKKETSKGEVLYDKAIMFYINGNSATAIKIFQSISELPLPGENPLIKKTKQTISIVESIDHLFRKGQNFIRQNKIDEASKVLKKAVTLEKRMPDIKNSKLQNKVNKLLTTCCFQNANNYFEIDDFESAAKYCEKCNHVSYKHSGLKTISSKLCDKAKKEYEKGYVLEDMDPKSAIESWEKVLKICTQRCKYFKKAKASLAKHKKN